MRHLQPFMVCLLTLTVLVTTAAEPTVGIIGWTNIAGTVEGVVTSRPVDSTLPRPPLGFVEYLPKGYDQSDPNRKWPLLVFLAGIGEIGDGTDTEANLHQLYTNMVKHGPLHQVIAAKWDFPAIVIAPQQPGYWNNATILKPMFDYLKSTYRIDVNRMYLTGLCDGAVGALNFATQNPGYLAGIMPIETATNPNAGVAARIKDLPMWAVHCFSDPDIARTSTIAWVNQTTQADVGSSDVMGTYPGYAGKTYHAAADSDPLTQMPLNPFGPTTTIFGSGLTAGSSWISFGSTTFGSAAFNSWGSTDAAPYARVHAGIAPDIWAKNGVMLRDSSAPGAMYAMVAQGPNREVFMQWRNTPDGISGGTGRFGGSTAVKWVRLAKAGAVFTGSYSMDGVTWTVLASKTFNFSNSTYLGGLAVNSHNVKKLYTQDFTNLSLNGVAPGSLTDVDIGSPMKAGSARYADGTWTVTGGGKDIWSNPDQFNYAFTEVSGNQEIIAKVGGAGAPPGVVSLGKPNGLYLTHPYTGATAVKDIYIQIPVGYNATAYYDAGAAKWVWQRGQSWDQARSGKRIFTMCWYQNHVQGWLDTYANGGCWDWLLSQQRPSLPVITLQPQGIAVTTGQQATFTAAVGGSVPTSYQWMRNGVAIPGATSTTYSIAAAVASDHGASYILIASNAIGQTASNPAVLTVYSSLNTITMAGFGDHQVIQRELGSSAAAVRFSGTYGGTPDHIQVRVTAATGGLVAVDWTTINALPGAGSYVGSLSVPQGGWYQSEVRSRDAAGKILGIASSSGKWGVGINILCIGQSNMLGFGDRAYTIADDRVGLLSGGSAWRHMADPWISGGKASCGPALGNALVAALDIPVGLVPSAAGTNYMVGTSWNVLSQRNAANHGDLATVYGQALSAAVAAGGVEFVLVSQGANEAVAGTVDTATYVGAFTQMRNHFIEDLPGGAAVRFSLSQLGRRLGSGTFDAGYDAIREAHRQLDNGTTVLLAGGTLDFPIVDTTSHFGGISQATHGRRFARALLHSFGQLPTYGGPRIVQARFLDGLQTTVRVSVDQRGGSDFTPASLIPGFMITDSTGPHAVSGSRVDATTIDLTGDGPFLGPTSITYLAGMNPAGPAGLFADNQIDPEPLLPLSVPLAVGGPVLVAPTIITGPGSQAVPLGQTAAFTVLVAGSAPITCRWMRDGTAIPGAVATTYVIPSVSTSDAGAQFTVTVSNPAGSATSTAAVLTVSPSASTEPSLAINGWTNRTGVVEGVTRVRPVNTTLPRPPYGYVDYLPLGYDPADTSKLWPLLVSLPSVTEAGDGTDSDANGHQLYSQMVKYGPLFQIVSQQWDFPAIIIAPQVTTNWAKPLNVKNVVEYAKANYRVDTTRIYMTGNREGASGTLRYAVAYPADLAAILTIEANIAASAAQATPIRNLPMWAAHSFADQAFSRSSSIGWIDALAVAAFAGTSDVMATYPGYGDRNHFAVDSDPITRRPLNPDGAITVITGAQLVPGSTTLSFPSGVSFGSSVFGMWSGSEVLPFARITVAGDGSVYTAARGYAASVTLTAAYSGATTNAVATIQTPVGYNATAYRDAVSGVWGWHRDLPWDQMRSDQQVLTLFWYQTAANGWTQIWADVNPWNWLFSQVKAPIGAG